MVSIHLSMMEIYKQSYVIHHNKHWVYMNFYLEHLLLFFKYWCTIVVQAYNYLNITLNFFSTRLFCIPIVVEYTVCLYVFMTVCLQSFIDQRVSPCYTSLFFLNNSQRSSVPFHIITSQHPECWGYTWTVFISLLRCHESTKIKTDLRITCMAGG